MPIPTRSLTTQSIAALVVASAIAGCKIDKLINDPGEPSPPGISLVRVEDSAALGSIASRQFTIDITNQGSHQIEWTASTTGSAPWLEMDRVQGTAPSALLLTLSPISLSLGSYRDTIVVARAELPDVFVRIPVLFEIGPCRPIDTAIESTVQASLESSDCSAPHRDGHFAKVYRIFGQPADSISLVLTSTEFSGSLILTSSLDPQDEPLIEQSDCESYAGSSCVGNFSLSGARPLYVEVTSQTPSANGVFQLLLTGPSAPAPPTGLGQFADEQGTIIPHGGTVPNNEMFVRGIPADDDPTDSVRLEIEIQPIGTALTGIPTHTSAFHASGDTASLHIDALMDDTGYQWQARAVDETGRASDWSPFGTGDPDFQVVVQDAPLLPPYIGQFRADQITPIPPGGAVQEQSVVLKATVVDNDPQEMIRLEVEVRDAGSAFQNTPTASSILVPNGESAVIVVAGLLDLVDYRWQARAVDQSGLQGPWLAFASTHGEVRDFGINVNANELVVSTQPTTGIVNRPLAPITIEARKPSGAVDTAFTGQVLVDILPGTGTPGASVSGTTLVTAVRGTATFSDLTIDMVGSGYRLTFLTTGLPPAVSAPIVIAQTIPTQLVMVTQPSNRAEGGKVFAQQPIVELRDADGNATGLPGSIISASLSPGPLGVLTGTTTVLTNGAGRAEFKDLAITGAAGSYTLVFSETNGRVPSVISNPIQLVNNSDIDPTRTTVLVPAGQVGRQADVLVTMRNSDAIPVANALASLSATFEVESANARSALAIVANPDSTHTVSYKPSVPGTDLIAISVNGTPVLGSPFSIAVAGAEVMILTQPSPLVQEGTIFPQQPVLRLVDAAGNALNADGITVSAELASGKKDLKGTMQMVTGSDGVARFVDLQIKGAAGIRTLRFVVTGSVGVVSNEIDAVKGALEGPVINNEGASGSPANGR